MAQGPRVCPKCGERYSADVIFCPKDGTPLGTKKTQVGDDPYAGLTLAGQFELKQLIGIGAMGRVYRAHQAGIDRDVAVKVLHRELLRNETLISRFHREAKVASRLVHPNVVQVLMTGSVEPERQGIGGEAYLVMEFLDGISLRTALSATDDALPLPRALHIILQVCDAVGEAHTQGVVHRDLKPENVMLVRRGDDADFVKVLDFGVAKIEWADNAVATQAGVIFGTARYISPEGAQGQPVTAASDVYSITTMLFQCLAGRTPFDGDNPVAILLKHTSEDAPDVRSFERSSYVPEPVARVIAKNLAKRPEERCADARELGRALVEAATDSGLSPDDLVLRSTLLGGARAALQLTSMQRTKSLGLTPELARKLGPGATAVLDGDDSTGKTMAEEAPPWSTPAPTAAGERPSRPSGVDATLDEASASPLDSSPSASSPTSSVARTAASTSAPDATPAPVSRPASGGTAPPHSAPGPFGSSPDASPGSLPPGSLPPGSLPPSSHASLAPDSTALPALPMGSETPFWRRGAIIALCFFLGAGASVLIAHQLGVFERAEPTTPGDYAARARRAARAEHWTEPRGENVKDLTDAALERWPGNEEVRSVRRDAARTLVSRARALSDEAKARKLAMLAAELDPENLDARTLSRKLGGEPPPPPTVSGTGEPDTPPAPKPTRSPSGTRAAVTPGPAASADEGDEDEPEAADAGAPAPPATSAGRWL